MQLPHGLLGVTRIVTITQKGNDMKTITDYLETIPQHATEGRDYSPVAHTDLRRWAAIMAVAATKLQGLVPERKDKDESNASRGLD